MFDFDIEASWINRSLGETGYAVVQPLIMVFGGDGADSIQGSGTSDLVSGGRGADTIRGNNGGDLLYGNQQDDSLVGGNGNDTVFGGQGSDFVSGGNGTDLLYGNLAADVLVGGNADDILYGGQGNDTLNGEGGNDLLFGNRGADIINGGATGNDTLLGGLGNDVFVFDGAVGADLIGDFDMSCDRITVSGEVTATQVGTNTILTLSDGAAITLAGVSVSDITQSLFTNSNNINISDTLPSNSVATTLNELGDFIFE
ncbi:MAG: hemolysin expression modulating protein [Rhodospirillaceae bacterium]|nr:hemolysin expression modulating protein [Rhodospirillaceae bacterium]